MHALDTTTKHINASKNILQWIFFRKKIQSHSLLLRTQRRFSYLHHQTCQELHSSFLEHSFCASLWQSSNKESSHFSMSRQDILLRLFISSWINLLVYCGICVLNILKAPSYKTTSKLCLHSTKFLIIYMAENEYKVKEF